MGRNKLIYALADYAIAVASDVEKGGTWAGVTEALKAEWIPVFILEYTDIPEGNRTLSKKGGIGFPYPFPESISKLPQWLKENANPTASKLTQLGLF